MTLQLSIQNLSFQYSATGPWIVDNVSLDIQEKDFIGIIGPNGGGKTTLIKLILKLLPPKKGTILHYPQPLKIGWVPQHFSYDNAFPISVQEVVLSGRIANLPWYGRYTKQDHLAAQAALATVGLSSYRHVCFSHLSGGQMQRVLLARALASKPQVLILDEPTANIDPKTQKNILQILSELNQLCTIIMITHDLHHATHCFNKVYFMKNSLKKILNTTKLSEYFCCNPDITHLEEND